MKHFKFALALILLCSTFSFSLNAQDVKKLKIGEIIGEKVKRTATASEVKKFFFKEKQIEKVKIKEIKILDFPDDPKLYLVVTCVYNDKFVSLARPIEINESILLASTSTTHTCTADDCSGACDHTKNNDGTLKGCKCSKFFGGCKHTKSTTTTEVDMEVLTLF